MPPLCQARTLSRLRGHGPWALGDAPISGGRTGYAFYRGGMAATPDGAAKYRPLPDSADVELSIGSERALASYWRAARLVTAVGVSRRRHLPPSHRGYRRLLPGLGHISATSWPSLGHLSATSRPPLGHLSATSRPPLGHLSATCRPASRPVVSHLSCSRPHLVRPCNVQPRSCRRCTSRGSGTSTP